MAIEDHVREKDIHFLCHFTRAGNLENILVNGLLLRDRVIHELRANFNDNDRADRTNAVCLTIMFPNYRMFYPVRRKYPGSEWVVVVVRARALYELRCAFSKTNAASATVTCIPLEQRMTEAAFLGMFEARADVTREQMRLKSCWTTDPQAEVLALDGVPREYIAGAIVKSDDQKRRLEELHPGFRFVVRKHFFDARDDYPYWR